MKSTFLILLFLATQALFASTSPIDIKSTQVHGRVDCPNTSGGALRSHVGCFTPRGLCVIDHDYSTPESRKTIWDRSYAGELIDGFLDHNSHEFWHKEMWKILFGTDQASSTFDCITAETECSLYGKKCSEFDDLKWPNAFYVFQSLVNIKVFFAQFLRNLDEVKSTLALEIPIVIEDFAPDIESDQQVNMFGMMGGALSMGVALSVATPEICGPLVAVSAIINLVGASGGPDGKAFTLGKLQSELSQKVLDATGHIYDQVVQINDAIFGVPGSDEKNIVDGMRVDHWKYNHNITSTMAAGSWLLEHPTLGLRENFDNLTKQLKQVLAWQILRLARHVYIVIDEKIKSPKDCPTNMNGYWDTNHNWCWNLWYIDDKGLLKGGLNEAGLPLWNKYGMDKYWTYRNAWECWDNDPKATLKDTVPNPDPRDTTLPKCTFGMEIKKGKYYNNGFGGLFLELDQSGSFPNRPKGQKVPRWWPGPLPNTDCKGRTCGIQGDSNLTLEIVAA